MESSSDADKRRERGGRSKWRACCRLIALSLFLSAGRWALTAEGLTSRERSVLAREAQSAMARKDYRAAVEKWEAALLDCDRKSRARWTPGLGHAYEALGNFQKALAAYQTAYDLSPKSLERSLDLARLFDRVDLKAPAIDLYKTVLERNPRRSDVKFALASLHFRSGNLAQARQLAQGLLESDPRDLALQRLLAAIEEAEGDLAAAAHRWEVVLKQAPQAGDYFHLAVLWRRQGQYDLASAALEKAGALGAPRQDLLFERGVLSWVRGNASAAAAFWREDAKVRPQSVLPVFFLALAEKSEGKPGEARALMRRARSMGSDPLTKELAEIFLKETNK